MIKKEILLKIIGIIFLVFGIIAIINTLSLGNYSGILWFCYLGLIIIGIGVLRKNTSLIESQLNILLIPQIIWIIDFVYFIINGYSLFNIVDYFFIQGPILSKIITIQHLFAIPLSLISIALIKEKKEGWKISIMQITIFFILIRILTTSEENINWVYHTSLNLGLAYYPIFWFAGTIAMIFITNLLLKIYRENFNSQAGNPPLLSCG